MKKTLSSKKPVAPSPSSPNTRQAKPKPNDFSELRSLQEIKELIEFAVEKQFEEIELARGDFRLHLRKGAHQIAAEIPVPVAAPVLPPVVTPSVAAPLPQAAPPAPEDDLHILTSPIVGTFYRASSPTTEAFVKIGDQVELNQTLCIVEAMKLMNEIQSDVTGTIVKILAENGQPVEYGQPLFGIKI